MGKVPGPRVVNPANNIIIYHHGVLLVSPLFTTVQGYTGKMYLDQGWLTQQTSDSVFWRLTATFQNEVKEFKGSTVTFIDTYNLSIIN